jgi:gluconate kinase
MIVLIMGLTTATRTAVSTTLAATLGWDHVHVADELGEPAADRVAALRARMSGALSAGRSVVYSCPALSAVEWRTLRESLRHVELVRLQGAGDDQPPLATALTLDGQMSPSVLAATIRAVLRLEKAR